jgi:CcmD family protein
MSHCRRGLAVTLFLVLAAGPAGRAQPSPESLPPAAPPQLFQPGEGPGDQERPGRVRGIEPLRQQAEDGFVPISELPPDEQLPAAPMLVAAYSFVVIAIFAYLLTLSRRLEAVRQEIARLDAEMKRSARP